MPDHTYSQHGQQRCTMKLELIGTPAYSDGLLVQAQLRDEEELSSLISAKMHMRSDSAAPRQTREPL